MVIFRRFRSPTDIIAASTAGGEPGPNAGLPMLREIYTPCRCYALRESGPTVALLNGPVDDDAGCAGADVCGRCSGMARASWQYAAPGVCGAAAPTSQDGVPWRHWSTTP